MKEVSDVQSSCFFYILYLQVKKAVSILQRIDRFLRGFPPSRSLFFLSVLLYTPKAHPHLQSALANFQSVTFTHSLSYFLSLFHFWGGTVRASSIRGGWSGWKYTAKIFVFLAKLGLSVSHSLRFICCSLGGK